MIVRRDGSRYESRRDTLIRRLEAIGAIRRGSHARLMDQRPVAAIRLVPSSPEHHTQDAA